MITAMNNYEFDTKWQQIRQWLNIYLSKFPMVAKYFNHWINLAFANGPKVYEELIDYLAKYQLETPRFNDETYTETHHILCKFDGGLAKKNNEIELYKTNHILAHIVRFITLKKPGDALAVIFRLCSDDKLSLNEKSKIIAQANKDRGILFWSSEWQKTQGQKGGKKGGFANTVTQFAARSKVGKIYGRQVGLSNQTAKTKKRLQEVYCFYQKNFDEPIYRFNPTYPSFADICNILDELSEKKIIHRTSFYKIFNRERPSMYNWKSILEKDLPEDCLVVDFYYDKDL